MSKDELLDEIISTWSFILAEQGTLGDGMRAKQKLKELTTMYAEKKYDV